MSLSSKYTRGGAVKSLVRVGCNYEYQYSDAQGKEITEAEYNALMSNRVAPAATKSFTPPAIPNKPVIPVKTSEQRYAEMKQAALDKALQQEISRMVLGGLD